MYKDLETGEGTEFKHFRLCYIVIHCIPIYATYYTFYKILCYKYKLLQQKLGVLKGVFAKNKSGYRFTAKNKRF